MLLYTWVGVLGPGYLHSLLNIFHFKQNLQEKQQLGQLDEHERLDEQQEQQA